MKKLIAALVAGILIGALVMALAPASAHHTTALNALKDRVARLEKKTQLMNRFGDYNGFLHASQVWTTDGGEECWDGDDAVWISDPNYPGYTMLWCTVGSYPSSAQAQQQQQARKLTDKAIRSRAGAKR